MKKFVVASGMVCMVLTISGCKFSKLDGFQEIASILPLQSEAKISLTNSDQEKMSTPVGLGSVVEDIKIPVNLNSGIAESIREAVQKDFKVLAAQERAQSQRALAKMAESGKELQLSGTLYGGVEDVTDETTGVALVLSGNRLLFDGGLLQNTISAETFKASSYEQNYYAIRDNSAYEAVVLWLELHRFTALQDLISKRLEVLDPLIEQLEKIADAGIGDITQVAAAQRTVSLIRITEAEISEKLALAELEFESRFGGLPNSVFSSNDIMTTITETDMSNARILEAPAVQSEYEAYRAAIASLNAVEAKGSFNVGFEAKVQRPFGGSDYDSDESLGVVARKTLMDGNRLKSEKEYATARVEAQYASLKDAYRDAMRAFKVSHQTIKSMDKAIAIAADNAKSATDEIEYLRKQLIIGQSTLDSVLSAEARLYDAEAKEINFVTEKRKAQLLILATTGEISSTFQLK